MTKKEAKYQKEYDELAKIYFQRNERSRMKRTHFEKLDGYPFVNKALCGALGEITIRYPNSNTKKVNCKECLKLMKKLAPEEFEV